MRASRLPPMHLDGLAQSGFSWPSEHAEAIGKRLRTCHASRIVEPVSNGLRLTPCRQRSSAIADRCGQRQFGRPSKTESVTELITVSHTSRITEPLVDGFGLAPCRHHPAKRSACVLIARNHLTVPRGIRTTRVEAINRETGLPAVGVHPVTEPWIGRPFRCDVDAFIAVPAIVLVRRRAAPSPHVEPYPIGAASTTFTGVTVRAFDHGLKSMWIFKP
jgi:hypothetical protein